MKMRGLRDSRFETRGRKPILMRTRILEKVKQVVKSAASAGGKKSRVEAELSASTKTLSAI